MEESSFNKGFKISMGVIAALIVALVVIFIAMPVGCVACVAALGV